MEEIKVKKAKLYEEDGRYYIDVTYLCEDNRVIKEAHFPKMPIPLENWMGNVNTELGVSTYGFTPAPTYSIKLGRLLMPLERKDGTAYTEKIIEEKTQEMTIEEIENKLGHKIKIVNEK